jgi:hypothetical protein
VDRFWHALRVVEVDGEHVKSARADNVANVADNERFIEREADYPPAVLQGLRVAKGDDTDYSGFHVLREVLYCAVGDSGALAIRVVSDRRRWVGHPRSSRRILTCTRQLQSWKLDIVWQPL